VLWGSDPNYWAEGINSRQCKQAFHTNIKEFGVEWGLTSDNLLHQAEVGNCTVKIPRIPSGDVRLGTIFQLLVCCSHSPAEDALLDLLGIMKRI
jgi:hypothetical protein